MITIDTLEVLLRSVPQYFLFGGLAFYILGWVDKKVRFSVIAEILFIIIGIAALVVMLSDTIPSPYTEGMVEDHLKLVIKVLILLVVTGLFSLVSLIFRWMKKSPSRVLMFIAFSFAIFTFFQATSMSKVNFQLNRPEKENTTIEK